MNLARTWSLVRDDLDRNRRHFALAALGIVVGIATFTFFMALGFGIRDVVLGKVLRLDRVEVVRRTVNVDLGPLRMGVGDDGLDDTTVAELAGIPGVETALPRMKLTVPALVRGGEGLLGSNLSSEIVADGIDPSLVQADLKTPESFAVRSEGQRACGRDADCGDGTYCLGPPDGRTCRPPIPVLASNHLVELYNGAFRRAHNLPKINPDAVLGFELDLRVGASMLRASKRGEDEEHRERIRLVGFSDHAIPIGMTMPLGEVRRFNAAFGDEAAATTYHSIVLELASGRSASDVVAAVQERGFEVVDRGARQAALLIAILTTVFGLVSGTIVAVAAVSIMHTLFMLIYQRRTEFAVMRAVGATRNDIRAILLMQAATLGLAAGALGVLLGWGAMAAFDLASAQYVPDFPYKPETYFALGPGLVASALAFAVLSCVGGALFPANRAATSDPAPALTGR